MMCSIAAGLMLLWHTLAGCAQIPGPVPHFDSFHKTESGTLEGCQLYLRSIILFSKTVSFLLWGYSNVIFFYELMIIEDGSCGIFNILI